MMDSFLESGGNQALRGKDWHRIQSRRNGGDDDDDDDDDNGEDDNDDDDCNDTPKTSGMICAVACVYPYATRETLILPIPMQ